MIVVKLMGGLGNQLFQYATGKSLAWKLNVPLTFDTTALTTPNTTGNYSIRDLELTVFNTEATIATAAEICPYKKNKIGKIWNLFLFYLPIKIDHLYIREPYFHFFKRLKNAPENCYLEGYWQSEHYFLEHRKELLVQLSLSTALSAESLVLAEKMKQESAVSIHVRRGDYVSIAHNTTLYEVCGEEYYTKAMEHIGEKIKNPVFYVFSDEPNWFKEKITTTAAVIFVEHNTGKKSYEDLWLMSLCQHNIIANSSFSWWGAWLNTNEAKTVIAPAKWFKNKEKNTNDLIPKTWIKL
jgi:Glycosyl transferase family 11